MDLSILNTIGIVDCALFKRVDESFFKLEDMGGVWLRTLFPQIKPQDTIEITSDLVFLHDFLVDAEEYWKNNKHGQMKSGIWTEEIVDTTLYLEAYASCAEQGSFLIIRNAEQTYHERRQTLQIAREITLSNSEVIERHDYLSERLRAILLDNTDAKQRLPLHEAIQYANIGIMITDDKLAVLHANRAAFETFDETEGQNHEVLLSKIRELLSRQYPEKVAFTGNRVWQGEIYYFAPPLASKWVNLNINPVIGETGKITHWIISFNDQTRIKHLLQTNEELTFHDPLTGLPNRQYFWQHLQELISSEQEFSLINIDIINFKSANELYGYLEGDELLKQISNRFVRELSEDDFITRMGADEFMIIRKRNEARLKVNQISFEQDTFDFASELFAVSTQPYYTRDDRRCELPIKMGITNYPHDADIAERLLNNSALALSQAKLTADEHIQIFNEELNVASSRRVMLEEALKSAIDEQQFEVYLQPIYEINSHKIVKAEALLRWRFNNEVIMPDEFIPIAESSNTINTIGRWVIKQVFHMASELKRKGFSIPLSINFSPNQIYDINLISFIKSNIEYNKLDPSLIELEVTEGVLINNYQKVSTFLRELKRQGFTISVDDFGTGYCSLSYLKHLPIDTLKIDRTFIHDVDSDEDDSAIVSAIIALAQKLKLGVIAEGIENKEQQDFLVENNCNQAQGFYFAKPMPFESFIRFCINK